MTNDTTRDGSNSSLANLIAEAQRLLTNAPLTATNYAAWRAKANSVLSSRFGETSTITRRVQATGVLPTRFHESSMEEVVIRLDVERRERLGAMKTALEALLKDPSATTVKT